METSNKIYRKYVSENNSGKRQGLKEGVNCLVLRYLPGGDDEQDFICQYMNFRTKIHYFQYHGFMYSMTQYLN